MISLWIRESVLLKIFIINLYWEIRIAFINISHHNLSAQLRIHRGDRTSASLALWILIPCFWELIVDPLLSEAFMNLYSRGVAFIPFLSGFLLKMISNENKLLIRDAQSLLSYVRRRVDTGSTNVLAPLDWFPNRLQERVREIPRTFPDDKHKELGINYW